MKTLKPLSYLTLPTAFIYLAATLFTVYQYYHVSKTFAAYGVIGDIAAEFLEPYILAGIVFFLFFIFGLIISYGLSRNGRWALHGWFTLLACFLVFHIYRLISVLDGLPYIIVERVFEILCVLMLAVITFMIMKLAGAQTEMHPPPPPEQWNTPEASDVS